MASVRAMQAFLADLKGGDEVLPLAERYIPFREFNELIGVAEQFALGERYSA